MPQSPSQLDFDTKTRHWIHEGDAFIYWNSLVVDLQSTLGSENLLVCVFEDGIPQIASEMADFINPAWAPPLVSVSTMFVDKAKMPGLGHQEHACGKLVKFQVEFVPQTERRKSATVLRQLYESWVCPDSDVKFGGRHHNVKSNLKNIGSKQMKPFDSRFNRHVPSPTRPSVNYSIKISNYSGTETVRPRGAKFQTTM